MKNSIAFIFILLFSLSLTSCKECTICQIKAGSYYESAEDEFCGTPSQVEEFEEDYEKRAESLGLPTARAYCTRQ